MSCTPPTTRCRPTQAQTPNSEWRIQLFIRSMFNLGHDLNDPAGNEVSTLKNICLPCLMCLIRFIDDSELISAATTKPARSCVNLWGVSDQDMEKRMRRPGWVLCLGLGGAGKTWWRGQDHPSPQTPPWNLKINNKTKHPEADDEEGKVTWLGRPSRSIHSLLLTVLPLCGTRRPRKRFCILSALFILPFVGTVLFLAQHLTTCRRLRCVENMAHGSYEAQATRRSFSGKVATQRRGNNARKRHLFRFIRIETIVWIVVKINSETPEVGVQTCKDGDFWPVLASRIQYGCHTHEKGCQLKLFISSSVSLYLIKSHKRYCIRYLRVLSAIANSG